MKIHVKPTSPSELLEIAFNSGEINVKEHAESYPEEKKEIEKEMADKIIKYFNDRYSDDFKLKPNEHPDFIMTNSKIQSISLELMEIVDVKTVHFRKFNRQYSDELKKIFNCNDLKIEFSSDKYVRIPEVNSEKGNIFLQEIKSRIELIMQNQDRYLKNNNLLFKNNDFRVLVNRSFNRGSISSLCFGFTSGFIQKDVGALYVYSSFNGFIQGVPGYSYREEDYVEIERAIREKYKKDYLTKDAKKSILLLYTFGVRPDFDRLKTIIERLNTVFSNRFSEVWFLKPYPEGVNHILNIYEEK